MKSHLEHSGELPRAELQCPSCGAPISLSRNDLVDGRDVRCPRCNDESTLIRERVEHSLHDQWSLGIQEREEDR